MSLPQECMYYLSHFYYNSHSRVNSYFSFLHFNLVWLAIEIYINGIQNCELFCICLFHLILRLWHSITVLSALIYIEEYYSMLWMCLHFSLLYENHNMCFLDSGYLNTTVNIHFIIFGDQCVHISNISLKTLYSYFWSFTVSENMISTSRLSHLYYQWTYLLWWLIFIVNLIGPRTP